MGTEISIIASADKVNSGVSFSGSNQHIITDKDVQAFNIEDANLKNIIGKHFVKEPTYAYLHDSTISGPLSLFMKYLVGIKSRQYCSFTVRR